MQFDPEQTKQEDFNLANGKRTKVPMMRITKYFHVGYNRQLNVEALELPYKGDKISMVVLLPSEGSSISSLEKALTVEHIMNPVRLFTMYNRETEAYLPRFKLEDSFSLGRTLADMGMTNAFSPGSADFSGMTGRRELYISDVVHKVFMEVNEEGSEAAGATAVIMERYSINIPLIFRANRPFIFYIRERSTGSVLFLGKYTSPSA